MKKFLLIGVVVLLAVTLSGCKNAAEKTVETAIESTTGIEADVDNDSITLNTNEGSLTVGDAATIPSGFPSDVYIIDGDVMSAMTIDTDSTFQVQIDTPKSLSEAGDIYNEELLAAGWTITSTLNMTDAISIMAEKDDRLTTVSVGTSDGVTVVIINTSIISE
ncbi:MAG: hypothetical protein Q8P20_01370 [bacterium]|nr:hypothetical protein [bacterium]